MMLTSSVARYLTLTVAVTLAAQTAWADADTVGAPSETPSSSTSAPSQPLPRSKEVHHRKAAFIGGGIGALGGGLVVSALGLVLYIDGVRQGCTGVGCNSTILEKAFGIGFMALGGAGCTTGIGLLGVGAGMDEPEQSSALVPEVRIGPASATMSWRF
jgi:hypothetical protein